jgi:hypothetical protein
VGTTLDCTARYCPKESPALSRRGVAEKIVQFDTLDSPWTSSRRIAGQLDVPVRTLHYWVRRERTLIEHSSWPKRAARFLETPEGLDLLHRLFTAALLVFVEANDSAHARDKLAKARRVLNSMQATIEFFWTIIATRLAAWGYRAAVAQWLRQDLIPAYYLRRVAEKAGTAPERQRLRTLAAEVLARARSPDGLWGTFHSELQAELESKARQYADFFQRSSSCVEGRNGQLSLRHHALHHLIARKLQALTVLHNYAVQRADGSTAAGRFYGGTPRDLFGWLLEHLAVPARPRPARRSA